MTINLLIFLLFILIINTICLIDLHSETNYNSILNSSQSIQSFNVEVYKFEEFKQCYRYTRILWELILMRDKPYYIEIAAKYMRVDIVINQRMLPYLQFYRHNNIPTLSVKQIELINSLLLIQLNDIYFNQFSIRKSDCYTLIYRKH